MNNEENKVVYLRIDDIIPNRFQPREVFDETGLDELAESIKEHGVIQPIIVRQSGDKYELIAGERRTKASALAGLTTVPAIIKNMDDKESAKVSLLENLQRKNLSAIEEARTYKRILELDNMTQEDLAKTMGKSQPMVANKLRLLALPEEIQDALIKNQISERHARSLLTVKEKDKQLMLLDRIKNERLTVRDLDGEIKKMYGNDDTNNMNFNMNQDNNMNLYNPTNDSFNTSNNQSYNNFSNNFNNMGLNDYKTALGNNMYNQNMNNFSNMSYEEKPEMMASSNNNSNFIAMNKGNNPFITQLEDDDKPSVPQTKTLGSMFDDNMQYNQQINNQNSNNMMMSNIRENNFTTTENQFLPNFTNQNQNNFSNEPFGNNSFQNSQENFNNNMNNYNSNNQINDFSSMNQSISNNNDYNYEPMNNQMNNSMNYQTNNMNDFNSSNMNQMSTNMNSMNNNYQSAMSYESNQGGLFNQPLNIVDVNEGYNNDFSKQEDNPMNESSSTPFDNPLDDQYENILFAKPVPIQVDESNEVDNNVDNNINDNMNLSDNEEVSYDNQDITNDISNNETEEETTDDVEIIGENEQPVNVNNSNENQYISLEREKTIFNTRDAVRELKGTTDRIKADGIGIETEEIDFDDYYQITIKIKKND